MKPSPGFSEKVRARIVALSGWDPGRFEVCDICPGTNPDVTEEQIIDEMAKSMIRMRDQPRSSSAPLSGREKINVRDFVKSLDGESR